MKYFNKKKGKRGRDIYKENIIYSSILIHKIRGSSDSGSLNSVSKSDMICLTHIFVIYGANSEKLSTLINHSLNTCLHSNTFYSIVLSLMVSDHIKESRHIFHLVSCSESRLSLRFRGSTV